MNYVTTKKWKIKIVRLNKRRNKMQIKIKIKIKQLSGELSSSHLNGIKFLNSITRNTKGKNIKYKIQNTKTTPH